MQRDRNRKRWQEENHQDWQQGLSRFISTIPRIQDVAEVERCYPYQHHHAGKTLSVVGRKGDACLRTFYQNETHKAGCHQDARGKTGKVLRPEL